MNAITFIRRVFRSRPVVVQTYTVKQSDWKKLRDAKCEQLAREVGWPWPVYRRDVLGAELAAALEHLDVSDCREAG